jgi:hypothetical protein
VITNDMSDYINLLVRIAHSISNHILLQSLQTNVGIFLRFYIPPLSTLSKLYIYIKIWSSQVTFMLQFSVNFWQILLIVLNSGSLILLSV